jgi:hypothetical protein
VLKFLGSFLINAAEEIMDIALIGIPNIIAIVSEEPPSSECEGKKPTMVKGVINKAMPVKNVAAV